MKAFVCLSAAVVGFAFFASSGAAELTCKQRMAQGSVVVIKVAPGHVTEVGVPDGERITGLKSSSTQTASEDGRFFLYTGGATRFPISIRTTDARYSICAVEAKPGVVADTVVSLSRRD